MYSYKKLIYNWTSKKTSLFSFLKQKKSSLTCRHKSRSFYFSSIPTVCRVHSQRQRARKKTLLQWHVVLRFTFTLPLHWPHRMRNSFFILHSLSIPLKLTPTIIKNIFYYYYFFNNKTCARSGVRKREKERNTAFLNMINIYFFMVSYTAAR